MSTLRLEIVTPERTVYDKDVNMVVARGVDGDLGIMPHHIPLVTPLKIAPVKAKIGNNDEFIAVHGGFMEVRKDKVVILAESAELGSDIDVHRAQQAKDRAQDRLNHKQTEVDHKRAEAALQRALTRIRVGGGE
ncbi:F0F1 ATP synthase subunit epsilon [Cohnella ginsengisoli]|uniref:ATP synthase epsilon chain n=2 Tax=Cohnella TaxID=329857 RepID=A0A9X4QUV7_9BACL|nr:MULTISPECIES: F0F1 ATP synthase subunit epsilon [Cohnella]MDG0794487.1 F0F1 ATP synthase subunit epsilon [Cohnella ginsengisoli]MDG0811768.1 F0F1 ATP synthase subunit epsilon [Cohnella rhizosphaerae]